MKPYVQDWWRSSEEATRRAERPQANDWFRFLQRPHEYFDYRSAKKRCALCSQPSHRYDRGKPNSRADHSVQFTHGVSPSSSFHAHELVLTAAYGGESRGCWEVSRCAGAACRSSFPDFRHQHNSWDALWLEDAPQRVAEAVRQLDIDPDRSGKVQINL